jgi:O-antigen/teichoic acid export membrane protein
VNTGSDYMGSDLGSDGYVYSNACAGAFTPNDFGIFGTFSSILVIGSIFASGQLHLAFIKCHDDSEIDELYWLFKFFMLFGTLIVSTIAFLINFRFQYFPNWYSSLLPFSIWAYLSFEGEKMLAVRAEKFGNMSRAVSMNRLLSNISKIGLGKFFATPIILIISEVLTNTLSYLSIKKKISINAKKPKSINILLKKYLDFPIFATLSSFFQLGLTEFPVLILALYYDQKEIGPYVLSLRLLLQPLTVIGNSLGSVVSKKIVTNHTNKISSRKMVTKIYSSYILIGFVFFFTIKMIPNQWFVYILGENWANFKEILLPMSLLCSAKLSSGLHIYYYVAINEVRVKSIWKALQLTSVIASIVLCSHLPLAHVLWIASSIEVIIDLAFITYTISFRAD